MQEQSHFHASFCSIWEREALVSPRASGSWAGRMVASSSPLVWGFIFTGCGWESPAQQEGGDPVSIGALRGQHREAAAGLDPASLHQSGRARGWSWSMPSFPFPGSTRKAPAPWSRGKAPRRAPAVLPHGCSSAVASAQHEHHSQLSISRHISEPLRCRKGTDVCQRFTLPWL